MVPVGLEMLNSPHWMKGRSNDKDSQTSLAFVSEMLYLSTVKVTARVQAVSWRGRRTQFHSVSSLDSVIPV